MARKIVIVGGVAGGASAAAKARREDEHAEIIIYERGPYVSFANCGLPYFIAGEISDRELLLIMTPEKFHERYRVQVHINHEVFAIDRERKVVSVRHADGGTFEDGYDKLILSQGAQPVVPPFPGVDQEHVFTLRDIPDMDRISEFIDRQKPRHTAVIGGGFIGLEMAEAFYRRGLSVTVIEMAPHILPMLDDDVAGELQSRINRDGFTLFPGTRATSIEHDRVVLEDGAEVPADLVLLSAGVRPEVELAREAGLEIGTTGGVKVNGRLESSDPDIYAVGDAAETTNYLTGARIRIPLAGPANRQGRAAGANAVGAHMTYRGALGTSIVRVLDQTVGTVGLNSTQAAQAGLSFFTSMTRDPSHASYYPGAHPVVIKILAEESTGRLLGAQVLGAAGIDKRVDVLATAIFGSMSVEDLAHIDLAYSPPFGAANDPVNTAGFVASHMVRGDVNTISPDRAPVPSGTIVDVRNPEELARHGRIDDAINIPLSELRDRLSELDPAAEIFIYCQKGQRGYLATRILQGNGFEKVTNIAGGFLQARHNGWLKDQS